MRRVTGSGGGVCLVAADGGPLRRSVVEPAESWCRSEIGEVRRVTEGGGGVALAEVVGEEPRRRAAELEKQS